MKKKIVILSMFENEINLYLFNCDVKCEVRCCSFPSDWSYFLIDWTKITWVWIDTQMLNISFVYNAVIYEFDIFVNHALLQTHALKYLMKHSFHSRPCLKSDVISIFKSCNTCLDSVLFSTTQKFVNSILQLNV